MPAWWRPYVEDFVSRVTWLAGYASFSVSSFGRTRSHNAAVRGASHSQHLVWTAADLVPFDGDMAALEDLARSSGAFGYVLNEGDHVHVQLFAAGVIPDWVFDQVPLAA